MRLLLLTLLVFLWVLPSEAAVKFFTDYPNGVPLDSDFFVYQRNQTYGNASGAQVKTYIFASPIMTGNGSISGAWIVGGVIYGNGAGITNVGAFATVVTNFTAVTLISQTNITLFEFVSNIAYITTNISVYTFTTNLITQNISTTNLTIIQPGGATNLNLTPFSLMYSDGNDAEASLPNGTGILTNNGTGGMGWSTSITFTELDALNAYLTNLFTFITNSPVLATDGNGKIVSGVPLSPTNILISAGANITFTTNGDGSITIDASGNVNITTITNVTIYSQTNYSTNLFFVSGKGNTLIVTNVAVYGTQTNFNIAASSAVITKSDQVLTNASNAHGVFTNSATGPPSFGLLQQTELANLNLAAYTNWNGAMPTNNGGGAALVFGGPSSTATASILYSTNITAATTLALFDITHTPNTASGIKLRASCSGGTDRVLTFPNGCTGAGLGTPPAVTITNSKAAWFDIIYDPMTPSTNVFWSPVF